MLNINRIFVGFFLMGFLWVAFDVNPLISGLAVGLLFGLTEYINERR
tara:strand:+ start:115 stop:255 length:141 start_codon:yes stop_codon:yes gene_type:complete